MIDLGSGILRAGADDNSSLFSGLIIGTGSLFKLGTGTWTLSGNNTYSGQTTVSAGTLVVDGSQPQSPVTVNGNGQRWRAVARSETFRCSAIVPGSSPGILTSSNVVFASQGDYFVELNGSTPGTGYDQLNVRGTNQLGSSTLHVSLVPGFAPFEGQEFVIVNNDGSEAIQGTFAGLPNGSLITVSGLQFRIRYSDIFLNDVVLLVTNTAARLACATAGGGNGDADLDVNECNFLNVVITNVTGGTLPASRPRSCQKLPVSRPLSAWRLSDHGAGAAARIPRRFSSASVRASSAARTSISILWCKRPPTARSRFRLRCRAVLRQGLRFNNNRVTAIPDNGTVDSLISVSGITTPIKRVTVSLHITHAADSDLDISLIGPDGTIVNLSSDNGGASANYGADCTDANGPRSAT